MTAFRLLPLALAALLAACAAGPAKNTATKDSLVAGMNAQTSPRADFYGYVNGGWMARTQIPDDKTSWGVFDEIGEGNETRSLALLEQMRSGKVDTQAAPHEARLVTALYASYMDTAARDKAGIAPLAPQLAQIDAIASLADLQRYLVAATPTGDNPLFGWQAYPDMKNSKVNAAYVGPGELGLGKDYYQTDSEANRKVLADYQAFVARVLTAMGTPDAATAAARIVAYETEIAKQMLTVVEERDPQNYYNPRTIAELGGLSRNLALADYLQATGVKAQQVIVADLRWAKAIDQLVSAERLPLIKTYLRYRLLAGAMPVLSTELEATHFAFYGQTLKGQKVQRALPKRALETINQTLGEAFGRYWVQAYFPPKAKTEMDELVQLLLTAYGQRIDQLAWMSPATKVQARAKLATFDVKIGYPAKWRDYSALALQAPAQGGTLYANLQRHAAWNHQRNVAKIGQPVDRSEWHMPPQIVNAYYNPMGNEIVFPAGILQAPFFDWTADAASNFGAIGGVIGHEITHGFDDMGSQFDGEGNLNNWWTAEDRQRFDALTAKLVAQAGAAEVAPGEHINGKLTLGENLADLGGVAIARDALALYLAKHPQPALIDGLSQDQRFYMAWTRGWRNQMRPQALANKLRTDSHAPGQFRAVAPHLNMDSFHQTWGTKEGDTMWRAPADRLTIW
ncbi:MAG: M13 family metallopeptidase [Proteobacteria bacterium]|nr:M13 family metallopeptidase [Pseudomonadota bacterium]